MIQQALDAAITNKGGSIKMEHNITIKIEATEISKAIMAMAEALGPRTQPKEMQVPKDPSKKETPIIKEEPKKQTDFTSLMYQKNGELFEQCAEMMKSIDNLLEHNQKDLAGEILHKYSTDGSNEYRSINPKDWAQVISVSKIALKGSKVNDSNKSDKVYSSEEVRAAARDLSINGKRDSLLSIFEEFGAKKLSEIAEEKYPELMQKFLEVK